MRINKQKGGGLKVIYRRSVRSVDKNEAIEQIINETNEHNCIGRACESCILYRKSGNGCDISLMNNKKRNAVISTIMTDLQIEKSDVNKVINSKIESTKHYSLFMEQRKQLTQEQLIKAYQRMGFRIAEELNNFPSDSTAPFMVYNY